MSFEIAIRLSERGPMRNETPFDPTSMDKLETREDGSSTIIETITSFSNPSTGTFSGELTESKYSAGTTYVADWTYTDQNTSVTQETLFSVLDIGGLVVVNPSTAIAKSKNKLTAIGEIK